MRYTLLFLIVVLLIPVGLTTAQNPDECSGVVFINARARATVALNSAAYGYVLNLADSDVVLTGGEASGVNAVEIHTMTMENDVMVMNPLPDGLTIPAGTAAELRPGGLHIMMIGLENELVAGESLDLTLNFDGSDPLSLAVPIMDIQTQPMDMSGDDMSEGEGDMSEESGDMDMMMNMPLYPVNTVGFEGCSDVVLGGFYALPTEESATGAYGFVVNLSDNAVTLTGAASGVAGQVDILEIMTAVDSVEIPAGMAFAFQPDGWYIWLGELDAPLMMGDMVELFLIDDAGLEYRVMVPVMNPNAMMDMDMDMEGDS